MHVIIMIIIIWRADHPYSQLTAELRRTRLKTCSRSRHARAPLAASHINPLWPRSTAKIKSVWFFQREENRMVWKTLVAQQRTNAQVNSHVMALAGNRIGVTLVRGERFTHKPTMHPSCRGKVSRLTSWIKNQISGTKSRIPLKSMNAASSLLDTVSATRSLPLAQPSSGSPPKTRLLVGEDVSPL